MYRVTEATAKVRNAHTHTMTANIHKGLAVGKIPLNIISGEGGEVPECYTHFRGSHGLIRGL